MFGKVSGERGRHFQGGHQKNFGLQSETKEPQEEEAMCLIVKSRGFIFQKTARFAARVAGHSETEDVC